MYGLWHLLVITRDTRAPDWQWSGFVAYFILSSYDGLETLIISVIGLQTIEKECRKHSKYQKSRQFEIFWRCFRHCTFFLIEKTINSIYLIFFICSIYLNCKTQDQITSCNCWYTLLCRSLSVWGFGVSGY